MKGEGSKADRLDQIVCGAYSQDYKLYKQLKENEGQYNYLLYIEQVRRMVDSLFYSKSSEHRINYMF